MKKIIILLILSLLSITSNSQNPQWNVSPKIKNDIFAMSSPKKDIFGLKSDFTKSESTENKIDLKLKYKEPDQNKKGGLALILGGVGFATAAILESGDGKIYQGETARQIMLGTGIVLTISGLIIIGK